MTNRILDEYLARVRAELADLGDADREAVVDDMRGHLEQAISERMAADPTADLDSTTLEETRAFGEPAEIAAAHGGSGARKPSRPRRVPRWALIAGGLVLLLVAAGISIDLLEEKQQGFAPYERVNEGLVNQTSSVNETFLVPPLTLDLSIYIDVRESPRSPDGCAGLRITDPRGVVVLDEWDACGDMRHTLEFRPHGSGGAGPWRVEIQYRSFTGDLVISTEGHTPL